MIRTEAGARVTTTNKRGCAVRTGLFGAQDSHRNTTLENTATSPIAPQDLTTTCHQLFPFLDMSGRDEADKMTGRKIACWLVGMAAVVLPSGESHRACEVEND